MDGIVALDLGTTGVKAALVDRQGRIAATGYAQYATYTRGSHVEQAPEEWWQATGAALAGLWQQASTDVRVAGVALSGQMQDLVLVGADATEGRAILYSDNRAGAEAQLLEERIGADRFAAITGNPQGPASVLAKWLWLARHDPARLARAQTLLVGGHDVISWYLCGARTTDYTTAATTGLMDLAANRWDLVTLQGLGLNTDLLPALVRAGAQVGQVSAQGAAHTGLPVGAPVFQGVGDLGATTLGVGAGVPGRLYGYLGTSGWVASTQVEAYSRPDQGIFTLRHPDPRQYIQVAPMLTAGGNLEWLRGMLAAAYASGPDLSFAQINHLAAAVPAGSRGLLYLPYLAGERSPFSAPDARACLIGIGAETGPGEMARAVMEGTALAYRALRGVLSPHAPKEPAGPLLLVGGGAKSHVWTQVLADVLAAPVQVVADPGNAPARGAALVAGQTLGWFEGYDPAPGFFPVETIVQPDPAHVAVYDRLYALFAPLHEQLAHTFTGLAAIRQP